MFLKTASKILFPFINLFIKEVNGLENIPKNGPFILAANHSYFIDVPIIEKIVVSKVRRKVHFITTDSLMGNWFGNFILGRWLGFYPNHPTKYFHKKAIPTAISKLKKGEIIAIFPEGDVDKNKIIKAHSGVARIALEGYRVIPIGLKNIHQIGPKKYSFPRIKKVAIVNIGKPLKFKKISSRKINKNLLEKETRKIMTEIAKLSEKRYSF